MADWSAPLPAPTEGKRWHSESATVRVRVGDCPSLSRRLSESGSATVRVRVRPPECRGCRRANLPSSCRVQLYKSTALGRPSGWCAGCRLRSPLGAAASIKDLLAHIFSRAVSESTRTAAVHQRGEAAACPRGAAAEYQRPQSALCRRRPRRTLPAHPSPVPSARRRRAPACLSPCAHTRPPAIAPSEFNKTTRLSLTFYHVSRALTHGRPSSPQANSTRRLDYRLPFITYRARAHTAARHRPK